MTFEPELGLSLPDRHCGRCQRAFAGDPRLYFQTDWALCPECEEILLPHQHSRRPAAWRPEPARIQARPMLTSGVLC